MIDEYKYYKSEENAVFSILIPSWNNIEFLKLCIESIKKNSRYNHQIIVHVNEGTDNTLSWIRENQIDYTYSKTNIGICYAVNSLYTLSVADYIVYMNDDMYACPDWDFYLLEEIKGLNHNKFYLSATMIEPKDTGNKCVIAPFDFGSSPVDFDEKQLLSRYKEININDWQGASWPPSIVHRDIWALIGGFSTEFTPGMYSDPDFSMKLWQAGIRYYKGISNSKVYHFMSKSTSKLKIKVNGSKLFLDKWGMTANMFYNFYLHLGTVFNGYTDEPIEDNNFKIKKLKCKIKKMFS